MKIKEIFKITGIPVLLASLCCLAPIVLVLIGLSTVTFAASLTEILDGKYKWVFDFIGISALAISIVIYFLKKGVCTIDQVKRQRNEVLNKIILFFIVGISSYYVFFYLILNIIGKSLHIWH